MPDKLGNLGASKPTKSSSVGGDKPGGDLLDEMQRKRILEEALGLVQSRETSSFGDILKDPKSIAALLGGGAAALFGGGTGAAAGLGAGLGTLDRASGIPAEERAAKQEQIELLQDRIDKSQETISKGQNRLQQVLTQHPEALLDPKTGFAPDPALLGKMLGFGELPLFPGNRRRMNKSNENTKRMQDLLSKRIEGTTNKGAARILTKAFFKLSDYDAPDELVDGLVNSMGTDKWTSQFVNTIVDVGGITGLRALQHAFDKGLGPTDSEVWNMIEFTPKGESPGDVIDDRGAKFFMDVAEWERENQETVDGITRNAKDFKEANREIWRLAARDKGYAQIDVQNLIKTLGAKDVSELSGILSQVRQINDSYSMAKIQGIIAELPTLREKSPEELDRWIVKNAVEQHDVVKQEAKEQGAGFMTQLMGDAEIQLKELAPGWPTQEYTKIARSLVVSAFKGKEIGEIPQEKLAEAIKRAVAQEAKRMNGVRSGKEK